MYSAGAETAPWNASTPETAPWPPSTPYMLQMVHVPVMGSPAGGFAPGVDPRSLTGMGVAQAGLQQAQGAYFAALHPGDGDHMAAVTGMVSGFKYPSENIVMAAGQYREVRPIVAPPLLAGGGYRFHVDPVELPSGLQLDPSTGIIWGTPAPPAAESDAAGAYQAFTVGLTGPAGTASTTIGIKVVHFQPNNFKITHVSQLERNKYMVLIDTTRKQ
mmetsp:Transcript_134551/g.287886  ORF Transcript_134551/g.287886 Transcript_134551/m.287886 type:complete len:216 (-) Transcript_134551:115-762(-)